MQFNMHCTGVVASALCFSLASGLASAQPTGVSSAYPNRPVRLVVPVAPGGGQDSVSRILAPVLSEAVGASFFVDNRPGAGQTLGMDFVAKAPPDGYTLLMAGAAFTIAPFTFSSVPFDIARDFAPISQIAFQPLFLVIHPSLKVNTPQELVAMAKARPGELNLGLGDPGGSGAMAGEIFKTVTETRMVSVPYKNGPSGLMALMTNEVQVLFTTPTSAIQHFKSGKLKMLGTTGKERAAYLPDVPTLPEMGIKGVDVGPWQGLVAQAKLPAAIIDRLHKLVVDALQLPAVRVRLATSGADTIIGSTPKEFADVISRELVQNSRVIKAVGIKVQ